MRILCLALLLAACEGPAGPAGPQGDPGSDGSQGPTGATGDAGATGSASPSPWLTGSGVAIDVTGITFGSGSATIAFTLTDGNGVGLDSSGLLTESTVAPSFVLSQLALETDGSPGQYTAYTTKQVTGTMGTATQPIAGNERNVHRRRRNERRIHLHGRSAADRARPDAHADRRRTRGAYRKRRGSDRARHVLVRPDAGTIVPRQVVTDATCDSCHHTLDAHGGRWTSPDAMHFVSPATELRSQLRQHA